MEKLVLTPSVREIVINGGSADGAVDLFSYGPEMEPAARSLGSLCVVGWRGHDTSTMGYMVSLVAALARREFYAQPSAAPREAFTRALHRVNEVVEEFFKSSGTDLAIGIFAVAQGTVMVSRLDKFKILLAREGTVIDILNNVMLFSKEHLERREFSSIIHGSVQAGDQLLAFHPAKSVTAREKQFRTWLLDDHHAPLESRLAQYGTEHPDFSASFMHIRLASTVLAAAVPDPEPEDIQPPAPVTPPVIPPSDPPRQSQLREDTYGRAALAWSPRQSTPPAGAIEEPEAPRIIPTEYAVHSRTGRFGRLASHLRFVRLDGRGKAVVLALAALLVAGAALGVRNAFFVDEAQLKIQAAVSAAEHTLAQSRDSEPAAARGALAAALASLTEYSAHEEVRDATDQLTLAMDALDNAVEGSPELLAQVDPDAERVLLAVWASSSQSLRAITEQGEARSVAVVADGTVGSRVPLGPMKPDLLLGWRQGIIVMDFAARSLVRVEGSEVRPYVIPTQETVLDAAVFTDILYVLTDKSILKISDLDTDKPVTKQWLTDASALAPSAARIWVDGNVYTMGTDGVLTTYFKGKQSASVESPLIPAGAWRLIPAGDGHLAVASRDMKRVYDITIADGSLVRTLKLDTERPLTAMDSGPDGTVVFVTSDGSIWKLR